MPNEINENEFDFCPHCQKDVKTKFKVSIEMNDDGKSFYTGIEGRCPKCKLLLVSGEEDIELENRCLDLCR